MATINELLAELSVAYPKYFQDLGSRARLTMRLYASHLSDIPIDVLAVAVDELIGTEKWMPSIAEIRERCAERMLALPTESEALRQIELRMSSGHEAPPLHPLVDQALRDVGGYSAFRYTDGAIIRGQFGRLYREERARVVRQLQAGSMALDAGERPAGLPVARDAVS